MSSLECYKIRLKEIGVSLKLEPGTVLQFQEDEVDYIYFLESGVAIVSHYHRDGKETRLNEYKAGDTIGIEYVHGGGLSKYQVVSATNVALIKIKRRDFRVLLLRNSEISGYCLHYVLSKLRYYKTACNESNSLSKRGLIASEIKRMATENNLGRPNVISPKPTISDMALRLGVARETVSRTVSDMVKKKIIEKNKSNILITNFTMLDALIR